jgi:hypothetical protein
MKDGCGPVCYIRFFIEGGIPIFSIRKRDLCKPDSRNWAKKAFKMRRRKEALH